MDKVRNCRAQYAPQCNSEKNKQGINNLEGWFIAVEQDHNKENQRSADQGSPIVGNGIKATSLHKHWNDLARDFTLRSFDRRFDTFKILICKSFMNGHDEWIWRIKDSVLCGINFFWPKCISAYLFALFSARIRFF